MKTKPETVAPPPPAEDDPIAIAVRAYVQQVNKPEPKSRKRRDHVDGLEPSNIVVIFDTETCLDAAQHLRFGTYQVRIDGKLDEEGLFFDHKTLSKRDQRVLDRYAARHGLKYRTLNDFIDLIFFGIAFDLGATTVGFNLPFDISRIARGHGAAKSQSMKGGFSFLLSGHPSGAVFRSRCCPARPRVSGLPARSTVAAGVGTTKCRPAKAILWISGLWRQP